MVVISGKGGTAWVAAGLLFVGLEPIGGLAWVGEGTSYQPTGPVGGLAWQGVGGVAF